MALPVVGDSYAPGFPKPLWALGDFDYSGIVDHDDVTLLGVFKNPAGTSIPALGAEIVGAAAVPEPATRVLFAAALPLVWALPATRQRRPIPSRE